MAHLGGEVFGGGSTMASALCAFPVVETFPWSMVEDGEEDLVVRYVPVRVCKRKLVSASVGTIAAHIKVVNLLEALWVILVPYLLMGKQKIRASQIG
jgi:hypothetical protein